MRMFQTILLVAALAFAAHSVQAAGGDVGKKKAYPKFQVGITGMEVTIEKGQKTTVQMVRPGSPAAGKVQKGDVIISANGKSLAADDPRMPLGYALGEAEKSGQYILEVQRGGSSRKVVLTIPKLGAYSSTWPLQCSKSTKIIQRTASYLVKAQQSDGGFKIGNRVEGGSIAGCLASLFLLSTGEAKYLPNVRVQVRALASSAAKRPSGSNWVLGYQGILLGEYYLRTGDKSVLAGLKSICDKAASQQAAGAWGHGGVPSGGYVQSGLMNSAGVPLMAALVIARECGVDSDVKSHDAALKFFYRMAGHGNVCYGDHRAELWWPNTNGRNGMLACGLALLDAPHFKAAAKHMATIMADSYYMPEFGHTGGGFNVIWRGMATVHARPDIYRRQMDKLAWYYDLARHPDGGFSMLPSPPTTTRYTGLAWGTGAIGLTYTAPLKKLRITGAPRTKYSKNKPVSVTWGTTADQEFLKVTDATGFGKEPVEPDVVHDRLIGKNKGKATAAFCAQYLLHHNPMYRTWAGRVLRERGDAVSISVLAKAIKHKDPRVRRAVYDALGGYDNWGAPGKSKIPNAEVSKFLPYILKTLKDPKAAWWEVDGALFAMGRAEPAQIRKNLPLLKKFAAHEEWYIRQAAFWSIAGLGKTITGPDFRFLGEMYKAESHVFARTSMDSGFNRLLKKDKIQVSVADEAAVVKMLGYTLHSAKIAPGYDDAARHEAAHRTMMILKHFDERVYKVIRSDIVKYMELWKPGYQHSDWLITGSNWQHGLVKVTDMLGKDAGPVVAAFKKALSAKGALVSKAKNGKDLKAAMEGAIRKHGG
jgi:hypothetical protein